MSNQEEILARIRLALGKKDRKANNPGQLTGFDARQAMQHIDSKELLSRFEAELTALAGTAHRASDSASLAQILQSLLGKGRQAHVVLSRNPILEALGLHARLSKWETQVSVCPRNPDKASEDLYRASCFAAEIGITGVEFALAETGSLVLTSVTEGSQLSSLAPPVHIALYRRSQLRASLDDVLDKLPVSRTSGEASPGRSVVFVTGPSRTADIEQILIRGVHGPREVHAILVDEACFGPKA